MGREERREVGVGGVGGGRWEENEGDLEEEVMGVIDVGLLERVDDVVQNMRLVVEGV